MSAKRPDEFAEIGEDGWRAPNDPPNSDRLVQIAYDDMSFGVNTLGFYDGISEIPDSGRRFWWSSPAGRGFHQLPEGHVGAWRETPFLLAERAKETP